MQVTVEQSQSQRVERHVHTDVHDGVQARIRVDGIRAVSVEYVGVPVSVEYVGSTR